MPGECYVVSGTGKDFPSYTEQQEGRIAIVWLIPSLGYLSEGDSELRCCICHPSRRLISMTLRVVGRSLLSQNISGISLPTNALSGPHTGRNSDRVFSI